MNPIRFQPGIDEQTKTLADGFVRHVLDSCAPERLLSQCPQCNPLFDPPRPAHILAFGKASMGMARWCVETLGDSFQGGVILAPEQLIEPIHPKLTIFPADHPNPTQRNIDATDELRAYAKAIPADHACIICISGGGSAHLCSPRPGTTLEQIVDATRSMNESGAPIQQLNAVRRELETLKGGGLASTIAHVHSKRALILSDVLGDDLEIIASGPMMNAEHPVDHAIVGNHLSAAKAARQWCTPPVHVQTHIAGDAQTQGRALARAFQEHHTACIFAGETTVHTRGAQGVGGPCMEMALACAAELHESRAERWIVVGLATDGIDGPTGAAGAIITPSMIDLANARDALANHDTLVYLDAIGATIRTGPTGTNVNDLVVVIRR